MKTMQALVQIVLHEDWSCFGDRLVLARTNAQLWQIFCQSRQYLEFRSNLDKHHIDLTLMYLAVVFRRDVVITEIVIDRECRAMHHNGICGIDLDAGSTLEYWCEGAPVPWRLGLFKGPLSLRVPSCYDLIQADHAWGAHIRVQGCARLLRSSIYDWKRDLVRCETRNRLQNVLQELLQHCNAIVLDEPKDSDKSWD